MSGCWPRSRPRDRAVRFPGPGRDHPRHRQPHRHLASDPLQDSTIPSTLTCDRTPSVPSTHGRRRCRRWRSPGQRAVDVHHEDRRCRWNPGPGLCPRGGRGRHRPDHLQRRRGGPGPGRDDAADAGADHRRHPLPIPARPGRHGGGGAGSAGSTPGIYATRNRSRPSPARPRTAGLPIRIGVNAGSLDKDLLERYRRARSRGFGGVGSEGGSAISRTSTSSTSRSRSSTRTCRRWSSPTACWRKRCLTHCTWA